MTKIGILTFQDGYHRGATDFYPLIKWKKEFKEHDIYVQFFNSHEDKNLYRQDIVIIDYRYYRELTVHRNIYQDKEFIKKVIEDLKKKGSKVILFDTGDGAGGRQWDMIEYVDILLKKQVLKDKREYTLNKGRKSYMVFLQEYDLNPKIQENNLKYRSEYTPCPESELHKIKLGWNIGMVDYRSFPLSRFYPIGTSRLLNSIYKVPKFFDNMENRPIDSAFRGALRSDKENYAYQRNKVIELFQSEINPNYVTGDILIKKKYLEELRRSKTCVSPFGWGEVCFRDFEAIISGCVLIKPDMDHLETWPDLYRKNETYVSVRWDMSDLEETLNEVIINYEKYKPVIRNAQQIYKQALKDAEGFVDRFKKIVEI